MRWYKHWKWQCLLVAPLLPWLYLYYIDWLHETAKALGWDANGAGGAVVLFTVLATIIFGIGYVGLHDDD